MDVHDFLFPGKLSIVPVYAMKSNQKIQVVMPSLNYLCQNQNYSLETAPVRNMAFENLNYLKNKFEQSSRESNSIELKSNSSDSG